MGSFIQVLRLDLVAIHPLNILPTVARSCPDLQLPNLRTLTIHMDNVDSQLQLATRFMQPTVTSFEIQVYNPSTDVAIRGPPRCVETVAPINNYEAIAQVEHDVDPRPSDAFPRDLLLVLCDAIAKKMPRLTSLHLFVEHPVFQIVTPTAVPQLILRLPVLQTLELPYFQTTIALFSRIAAHPSLRTITRHRNSWPIRAVSYPVNVNWEGVDPVLHIPVLRSNSLTSIHTLHLNIGADRLLESLQVWDTRALPNLRSLDVDTKGYAVSSNTAAAILLAKIAERFPDLRELTISSIRFLKFVAENDGAKFPHINGDLLAPLTALEQLTVLKISAYHPSHIFLDEWPNLLQSWPDLEVLILGQERSNGDALDLNMAPGTAPLDGVLNTFVHYCPQLQTLSLRVDGTLASADPTSWDTLTTVTALPGLELVVPSMDRTRSALLVNYLKAVLPANCGLHVFSRNRERMYFTLCIGPGGAAARDRCKKGLHMVMRLWLMIYDREGRGSQAVPCARTRGELLVPALVQG